MNIPTAHSNESIERFLKHIREAPNFPKEITRSYLEEVGFTSGNDPELRHIFWILGFLDSDFTPTDQWRKYKEQGQEVLKDAVVDCYKELFEIFPNAAYGNTDKELMSWFRPPLTGNTRSSTDRSIRTFRKLCQLAGIVPDNRTKHYINSEKDVTSLYKDRVSIGDSQVIFQLPVFQSKNEYIQLFEALKEVFYK